MKIGYLYRIEDENNVSGTGRQAEVFVSDTGAAVVVWLSEHSSVNVYRSVGDVISTHGHGGKTELRFEPDFKRAYGELKSAVENGSLLELPEKLASIDETVNRVRKKTDLPESLEEGEEEEAEPAPKPKSKKDEKDEKDS